MQIHELTQYRLQEGFLDKLKSTGKNIIQQAQGDYTGVAAKHAADLEKQGYGAQYKPPSANWEDKLKQIQTNPAIAQYAKSIAAAWAAQAATVTSPTVGLDDYDTISKLFPTIVSFAQRNNNQVTTTQLGQYLAKNAPEMWKNTTDKPNALKTLGDALQKNGVTVDNVPSPAAAVVPKKPTVAPTIKRTQPGAPTPAEQEKLQQRIQAALGKQSMAEALTTAGPKATDYKQSFLGWSDNKFKSKDPTTYETLTMEMVRSLPGMRQQLDGLLDKIVQTRGTPQQAQFIEQYAMLATAGMQALSQSNKNKKSVGIAPGAGAAQYQLKQKLRAAGINDKALDQVGQILRVGGNANFHSTGNVQADALLLAMGLRPE